MPLFGFGDIKFNKGSVTRKGPLGDLVDDAFKTSTLRYPIDVGNYDKAHYMVFYIRQQSNTKFPKSWILLFYQNNLLKSRFIFK